MPTAPLHIDLHLPTSWNTATTDELETIAGAMLQCQAQQDRYHPFDWHRVKLLAVLAINHLQVVTDPTDPTAAATAADHSSFLIPHSSFPEDAPVFWIKRPTDPAPWPLTGGQLVDLCSRLDWFTDPKPADPLFLFPYPELTLNITRRRRSFLITHSSFLILQGPPPLLDGYSWRDYRLLSDWMQAYMQAENAGRPSDDARNHFLALLFRPAPAPATTTPGGSPSGLEPSHFKDFSPVRWQVILFWWSALMQQLQHKFPRVFKQQPVGKRRRPQRRDTPWDFYNHTIAVLQKYVGGLSEDQLNHSSYGTILKQLDLMAKEAEEMDRLNKKYRK